MAERKALALIGGNISEIPATDTIRGAGGGSVIPQLSSDPVAPTAEQTWVLKTQRVAGSPIGLLLSLTNAVNISTYALRYRTLDGTTVGTALT